MTAVSLKTKTPLGIMHKHHKLTRERTSREKLKQAQAHSAKARNTPVTLKPVPWVVK